jgi:hypothetical protein
MSINDCIGRDHLKLESNSPAPRATSSQQTLPVEALSPPADNRREEKAGSGNNTAFAKGLLALLLLAPFPGCASQRDDPLHQSSALQDLLFPKLDSDDRRFYRDVLLGN